MRRSPFRLCFLAVVFLCMMVWSLAGGAQSKTDEEKIYEKAVTAYLAGQLEEAASMLLTWLAEHPEDESARRILDQVKREQATAKDRKTDLQNDISYLRQERLRLQQEMKELKKMIDEASGSDTEKEPETTYPKGTGSKPSAPPKMNPSKGKETVPVDGMPSKWLQNAISTLGEEDHPGEAGDLSSALKGKSIPGLEKELSALNDFRYREGQARLVGLSIHSGRDVSRILRMELSEKRPFELDWHEDGKGLMLTVSDAAAEETIREVEDQYVKQIKILSLKEKLGIDIYFGSELSVEVLGGDRVIELALR